MDHLHAVFGAVGDVRIATQKQFFGTGSFGNMTLWQLCAWFSCALLTTDQKGPRHHGPRWEMVSGLG